VLVDDVGHRAGGGDVVDPLVRDRGVLGGGDVLGDELLADLVTGVEAPVDGVATGDDEREAECDQQDGEDLLHGTS
jgi:hypothetical protein